MLTHISIQNIAIVDNLHLDLSHGMSALTGETGAGKSIIIDALDLALGGRATASIIRHGAARAEISAIFNLDNIPAARQWLSEHELDDGEQVVLRRTINKEGRSKNFINGQASTQTQMRQLGNFLLNIHGQYEHQNLLKREHQRALLDRYGQHEKLLAPLKLIYHEWAHKQQQLQTMQQAPAAQQARIDLLQYQVDELHTLAIAENEFEKLAIEYKQLAHADNIRDNVALALDVLDGNDSIQQALNKAEQALQANITLTPELQAALEMLQSASIQMQEATTDIQHYFDNIELDPERLHQVEQRLDSIQQVARKHHVEPEALEEVQTRLEHELSQLQDADQFKAQLEKDCARLTKNWQQHAMALTKARQKAAKKLNQLITDSMQTLGMQGGKFAIQLQPLTEISAFGAEKIEFQVTANPGQPLQPLAKVASGGEMSRISLALQMVTAQKDDTSTLIFDEVDVGIGGGTAEVVGKLLRQLGEKAQVLCITHLPQVAAQAHQHLQVQKQTDGKQTSTTIITLEKQPRIEEIARMLGGVKITEQTLKHASEMLEP